MRILYLLLLQSDRTHSAALTTKHLTLTLTLTQAMRLTALTLTLTQAMRLTELSSEALRQVLFRDLFCVGWVYFEVRL